MLYRMTHQGLGEFEQMVLLAIAHLQDDAYAIPIVDEIERRTGRTVARAAVYITLRRLEEKGLLSSWKGEPVPERGGKSRRYVKLEPPGAKALREARSATDRMWRGVDPGAVRARGGRGRAPPPPASPERCSALRFPTTSATKSTATSRSFTSHVARPRA